MIVRDFQSWLAANLPKFKGIHSPEYFAELGWCGAKELTDKILSEVNQLKPIGSVPIRKRVLLYWQESQHFEDGIVYDDGDSEDGIYHVLFDGESSNSMPSHWMELPAFKK
jgi:hypothetical protein